MAWFTGVQVLCSPNCLSVSHGSTTNQPCGRHESASHCIPQVALVPKWGQQGSHSRRHSEDKRT